MNFNTPVFLEALFSQEYLYGAFVAVSLATLVVIIALILGFFLALGRRSSNAFLSWGTAGYVWILRALPALLILILIWNALPQLFPSMRKDWFTPYLGALLGLALLEAAVMTEIIRAALSSVDAGQALAGRAIGLKPWQIYWHVLIPQMVRVAIPTVGSEYINMVKMTSLASVISLQELLYTAQQNVSRTFSYTEYYSAASIYYLVIVSVLMVFQSKLERRYLWNSSDKARIAAKGAVKPWSAKNG
jgi:polar amino acid transport system permease protein